jgi:hypothetical protein
MKEEYLLTGPLEPTNEPYAVAKIAGIEMCWSYNRQYNTCFIPVMPTNLYGPNDNYDLRTQSFLQRDGAGNYFFAHKSFMEYFVACKFARELGILPPLSEEEAAAGRTWRCRLPWWRVAWVPSWLRRPPRSMRSNGLVWRTSCTWPSSNGVPCRWT